MRDNNFAMRITKILSLIAFTTAFVFSTAIFGLTIDTGTAQKISAFLQQDVSNGTSRDAEVYHLQRNGGFYSANSYVSTYASITSNYINQSDALDENGLPEDFQLAWLKHMSAWHKYEDFLKNNAGSTGSRELRRLDRQYNREINSTWYDVLRVSKKYGASIPAGAY
jgi:hypothetical protein